jgi:hypothetical protein
VEPLEELQVDFQTSLGENQGIKHTISTYTVIQITTQQNTTVLWQQSKDAYVTETRKGYKQKGN